MSLEPFAHSSGPRNASLALVGEAFGEQEEMAGSPFVGASGQELTRMLGEAGILRRDCFLTNVLALRPPSNNIEALCCAKSNLDSTYTLPPLAAGKYLRPEFLPHLSRLAHELTLVRPNLIIALGNTACWALLRTMQIGKIRGVVAPPGLIPGVKVLPTFHPAAVIRNWSLRPVVIMDFLKARREMLFPEIRRPERAIHINPSLSECLEWCEALGNAKRLATDIETARGQITCIGFAPSRSEAFVIPFADPTQTTGSYWPTAKDEANAWRGVKSVLESPAIKVFQNGLYDLQYLTKMGFRPANCLEDTMLLHHSLYPELQKGLGFLGSIYTSESSWKLMRARGKEQTKREE